MSWESIQATGWWSGFFFWASIVSLIGLGISEVASHRFSERKDELVERQQIAEKERHDTDIARVQHDAALAIERAASLEMEADVARKETAQAKLELQQLRFPRQLDTEKFKAGIAGISPQFFEVLYDQSAADGSSLAFQIFVALRIAGWQTDQKLPAPPTPQLGPSNLRDAYQLLPLTQQAGGAAWGVSVVTKGPISDDRKTPEGILGDALLASVASPVQTVGGGKDETMPAGKIRIIVGAKLPQLEVRSVMDQAGPFRQARAEHPNTPTPPTPGQRESPARFPSHPASTPSATSDSPAGVPAQRVRD